ncbi:MAG: ABC transporter ATP-binding protein [Chthonomonadales bacterium]|nr:ABC transporter ATP-binding protein [Chthonomonadales bacterium]
MLSIEGLEVRYGAIRALNNVSLEVRTGEIVTLIGANGAGKSTAIRAISGLVQPSRGRVLYQGHDIVGTEAHKLVGQGICQSPEGRRIFANLTVKENLELGAYLRYTRRAEVTADMERVLELFPRLKERIAQLGGTLSGGEQQMLAIGRALMSRPKLLLLDEPSLGLAPFLVQQIFAIIEDINRQGVTILLVEQNAFQALRVAHRGYVLETGDLTMQGKASDLLEDGRVRQAYLGR